MPDMFQTVGKHPRWFSVATRSLEAVLGCPYCADSLRPIAGHGQRERVLGKDERPRTWRGSLDHGGSAASVGKRPLHVSLVNV
jgi:hypothetical protein